MIDTEKLQEQIARDVRFVSQEDFQKEHYERVYASSSRFLDRTRLSTKNAALKLVRQIAKHATQGRNSQLAIDLQGHSQRTVLAALATEDFRTIEVGRFNTIKIKVAANSYVYVNTLWSKHIGEVFVYNIGPYGEKSKRTAILTVLKDILGDNDLKARQTMLFNKIQNFAQTGTSFNIADLYEINPALKQLSAVAIQQYCERLQAFHYLVTTVELIRRPRHANSIGYKKGKNFKDNPTILCAEVVLDSWSMVLRLLQNNTLTIEQVFASDAPFGLPTGKFLRKQDDLSLAAKVARINDLYMQSFYGEATKLAAQQDMVAIPAMEEAHQRYLRATTKSAMPETPGHKYHTPELLRFKSKSKRVTMELGSDPVKCTLNLADCDESQNIPANTIPEVTSAKIAARPVLQPQAAPIFFSAKNPIKRSNRLAMAVMYDNDIASEIPTRAQKRRCCKK